MGRRELGLGLKRPHKAITSNNTGTLKQVSRKLSNCVVGICVLSTVCQFSISIIPYIAPTNLTVESRNVLSLKISAVTHRLVCAH